MRKRFFPGIFSSPSRTKSNRPTACLYFSTKRLLNTFCSDWSKDRQKDVIYIHCLWNVHFDNRFGPCAAGIAWPNHSNRGEATVRELRYHDKRIDDV